MKKNAVLFVMSAVVFFQLHASAQAPEETTTVVNPAEPECARLETERLTALGRPDYEIQYGVERCQQSEFAAHRTEILQCSQVVNDRLNSPATNSDETVLRFCQDASARSVIEPIVDCAAQLQASEDALITQFNAAIPVDPNTYDEGGIGVSVGNPRLEACASAPLRAALVEVQTCREIVAREGLALLVEENRREPLTGWERGLLLNPISWAQDQCISSSEFREQAQGRFACAGSVMRAMGHRPFVYSYEGNHGPLAYSSRMDGTVDALQACASPQDRAVIAQILACTERVTRGLATRVAELQWGDGSSIEESRFLWCEMQVAFNRSEAAVRAPVPGPKGCTKVMP